MTYTMISEDKFIELLVAGISRHLIPNADVEWNAIRNKRQFDVLANIRVGPHNILVAYEVKNRNRPISVETLDAIVTKANDLGAQKAVVVSTSGFQSGCMDVASRHKVDLFNLSFKDDVAFVPPKSSLLLSKQSHDCSELPTPYIEDKGEIVGTVIETVLLYYEDGETISVPNESSQMQYYLNKTYITTRKSLNDLIEEFPIHPSIEGVSVSYDINIATFITPPDNYFLRAGRITKLEFEAVGRRGRLMGGNVEFEMSSHSSNILYENVVSGEVIETSQRGLPIGAPELTPGKFYFLYFPLRYFYCDKIEDDLMTIYMVESFQMGDLHQTKFTQKAKYSRLYVLLSDKKIVSRLKERLERLKSQQGK